MDNFMAKEDKHIECVSDFCGNHRDSGFCADVLERPDGSSYIYQGGAWLCCTRCKPEIIEDSDPHYKPSSRPAGSSRTSGMLRSTGLSQLTNHEN